MLVSLAVNLRPLAIPINVVGWKSIVSENFAVTDKSSVTL
jgi:hypothetical protein